MKETFSSPQCEGDPLLNIILDVLAREKPALREITNQNNGPNLSLDTSDLYRVEGELLLDSSPPLACQHALPAIAQRLVRNRAGLTVIGCYLTWHHLFWEDLRERQFPFTWSTPIADIMQCGTYRHWDVDWDLKCREEWQSGTICLGGTVGEASKDLWKIMPGRRSLKSIDAELTMNAALDNCISIISDVAMQPVKIDPNTRLDTLEYSRIDDVWDLLSRRSYAYFGVSLPSRRWRKRRSASALRLWCNTYTMPDEFQVLADVAGYISARKPLICPWPY